MDEASRGIIEEIIENKLKLFRLEIEQRIADVNSGAQGAVLQKLDEIREELRESQKNQGERIGKLESDKTKMDCEFKHIKEEISSSNSILNKIDEKLDRCITIDNLEEKLQKPLQEIKDSVTELRNTPSKEKAGWLDKIVWAILGTLLATVVALVLKQIGMQ